MAATQWQLADQGDIRYCQQWQFLFVYVIVSGLQTSLYESRLKKYDEKSNSFSTLLSYVGSDQYWAKVVSCTETGHLIQWKIGFTKTGGVIFYIFFADNQSLIVNPDCPTKIFTEYIHKKCNLPKDSKYNSQCQVFISFAFQFYKMSKWQRATINLINLH